MGGVTAALILLVVVIVLLLGAIGCLVKKRKSEFTCVRLGLGQHFDSNS